MLAGIYRVVEETELSSDVHLLLGTVGRDGQEGVLMGRPVLPASCWAITDLPRP
jgi:hypothetical protein